MKTPVLLIAFNRPQHTKKVFERIKKYEPTQLFVAIDGARTNRKEDIAKVNKVKKETIEAVDWDCNLKTLVRQHNVGCTIGVTSAIHWFFEHVQAGIIIEDDCLVHASFFDFCTEMLARYEGNEKVFHINGSNLTYSAIDTPYYFSKYNSVWGWATWKEKWEQIKQYPTTYENVLKKNKNYTFKWREKKRWKSIFKLEVEQNRETIWDFQYTYYLWKLNGISVTPSKNLVSNIGFDVDATHTFTDNFFPKYANYPAENMAIHEVKNHLPTIKVNSKYDYILFKNIYALHKGSFIRITLNLLHSINPKLYNKIKKFLKNE